MSFERIVSRDGVTFRLNGRFGPEEAKALGQALAEASRGKRLTIDFSWVREFQDLAFGALADSMRRCKGSVELLGLALGQRRILRYLGVEIDAEAGAPPLLPAAGRARRVIEAQHRSPAVEASTAPQHR